MGYDVIVVFGGIAMCFWLLLICVIGIANGPVGLVVFYEKDVKDRVIQMGLTTAKDIKRTSVIILFALFIPLITFVPVSVYFYNEAVNGGFVRFWDYFWELLGIYMIMNLFDRIFIDEWWVGHTKAWIIPGTEDLMPYIDSETRKRKWIGTFIGFPILAFIAAFVLALINGPLEFPAFFRL